jgi:hypothetical protein
MPSSRPTAASSLSIPERGARCRRHQRAGGRAGGNTDPAIRLDQHRELCIDEAEAFGAQAAEHQRRSGNADLGLGRGRNNLLVAVADDDVQHAHGDPRAPRTLDLGAADVD